MGREANLSAGARQAQLERLIGPTKGFGARDETGCPKCGGSSAEAVKLGPPNGAPPLVKRWCSGKDFLKTQNRQPGQGGCEFAGEHLHVVCPTCHYGWLEHCKDWVDDEVPLPSMDPSPIAGA